MSMATEVSLQEQLKQKLSPESILNNWLVNLSHAPPKGDEILCLFHFAYNAGLWDELLEALPEFLEKRWPVHWGILVEICSQASLNVNPDVVTAVLKGARKQNQVPLLVRSHAWDMKAPEIVEFRKHVLEQLQDEASRKKEILWEKLGFLRTQRMVEEEGKLLHLLQRMYPEDPQVTQKLEEFQDRWARHVLSSRSERKTAEWTQSEITAFSPEEAQWLKVMLDDMIALAEKKPSAAYALAVGLYFTGLYSEALLVLETAPDEAPVNWFRLELLMKARRFVETLALSQEIELRYADDPETSFAVHYIKSQALKGLGQHSQAVEMMKSLIAIRPTYRSAQSLLSAWNEEGG
jgi:hypothetical protein